MRERWHENILTLRLVDERGEARCVKWAGAGRLKRAGILHPYRFHFRLSSWRTDVAYCAAIMVTITVFGAILDWVPPLLGFGVSPESVQSITADIVDLVHEALIGTGIGIIWVVFAMGTTQKLSFRWLAPRYRHGLLAHSKCPWCLYDLSGSVANNDGLTTCSECGGVWKMEGVPACDG